MLFVVFRGIRRSVTQIPLHRRRPYRRGDEATRAEAGVAFEMRLGDTDLHLVSGEPRHVPSTCIGTLSASAKNESTVVYGSADQHQNCIKFINGSHLCIKRAGCWHDGSSAMRALSAKIPLHR